MLAALAMALTLADLDSATMKERGLEVLDQIRREYYLPKSKLYCDSIEAAQSEVQNPKSAIKQSGPAFNWGVGVMLSALNAAARLDSKYKKWLREYADATRVYWNDKGPVPGYDVLPGPKPVDRYYDDNAWMVLALVESYEILGDEKYLDWAEQALDYVLSGEDGKLGGGIYWRESDKKSKNTCSNAPSAAACLMVARYRRSDALKAKAKGLLEWTKHTLQDPADGLFWDNIDLGRKIDRTKWSYNTGLFLRAAAESGFDAVGLTRTLKSSVSRWLDPKTGAIKDTGRFAHLWLEGLAAHRTVSEMGTSELHPPEQADSTARQAHSETTGSLRLQSPPSEPRIGRALDYLWTQCRNPQGRFGDIWDRPFDPKRTKFELIDQASVARALLFAARLTSSQTANR